MEFEEIPNAYDLTGKVVKFKYPLICRKDNGEEMSAPYMLVTGGFGAHSFTMGRMLLGYFAETAEYAKAEINGVSGNTKEFPERVEV